MIKLLPNEDIMYKALIERDSSFEGVFIVGVKTTGIFCRATCRARKPYRKNVIFFNSTGQALGSGYRPCKVCEPLSLFGEQPAWLVNFLTDISNGPRLRYSDSDLKSMDIHPVRIRRWFKKNYNMTFQAYLRSLRINKAFAEILNKKKIVDSAFNNGYESLSGFSEAFKKIVGLSPVKNNKKIVSLTRILTPLGPMVAGALDEGICFLIFTDAKRMQAAALEHLKIRLAAQFIPGESKYFPVLKKQLEEYFSGLRTVFNLKLFLPGTKFQQKSWEILLRIPYGETISYQQQALAIGNKKAVRAVARCNADNPISIIIPCHRVIAKSGKLSGYGGGLWRKQYLLDFEQRVVNRSAIR